MQDRLKVQSDFFVPGLPAEQMRAIESIDPGSCSKVIFRFDEAFWPVDEAGNPIRAFHISVSGKGAAEGTTEWINLQCFNKDAPPILIGMFTGDSAKFGDIPEQQVIQKALAELREGFGALGIEKIPASEETRVIRWDADPLARGAWSSPCRPVVREQAGKPVNDALFFGGEAVNPYGRGVHGTCQHARWLGNEVATRMALDQSQKNAPEPAGTPLVAAFGKKDGEKTDTSHPTTANQPSPGP